MSEKKPLLLFLIGVEGAGHHLTRDFLKYFFKKERVTSIDKAFPFLFHRWDTLQDYMKKPSTNLNIREEYDSAISRTMKNYSQSNYMYSSASFPFGLKRDTLRRPDIIDMVELMESYFELRPMLIYRDPISCAYSAVRRKFNDNVLHQAKIVEDNLIFIKQQIEASGLDYRSVSYESFISSPDIYSKMFEEWWGVDSLLFEQGKQEIRRSTSKKEIPSETLKLLEEFFSPLRRQQWEGFLKNKDVFSS